MRAKLILFAGYALFFGMVWYLLFDKWWALYFLWMAYVVWRIEALGSLVFDKKRLNAPFTLFYDPKCPICSREICHLQGPSANRKNPLRSAH